MKIASGAEEGRSGYNYFEDITLVHSVPMIMLEDNSLIESNLSLYNSHRNYSKKSTPKCQYISLFSCTQGYIYERY